MADEPIVADAAEVYRRWSLANPAFAEARFLPFVKTIQKRLHPVVDALAGHEVDAIEGILCVRYSGLFWPKGPAVPTVAAARAVYSELRAIGSELAGSTVRTEKVERVGWRYFREGPPAEGERVLVKQRTTGVLGNYFSPADAEFNEGKWCNDNWHFDAPTEPLDRWCPIPPDPEHP